MALMNFASICLPYCLHRNEAGEWIALNREYKPLGFNTNKWIAYEQYPIGVKYKNIKKVREKYQRRKRKPEDENWIFLYNDFGAPWKSKQNMICYMEDLQRVCELLDVDRGDYYDKSLTFPRTKSEGIVRGYINRAHFIEMHIEKYGNRCYYCGDEMTLNMGRVVGFGLNKKRPTIDHIQALARGGKDHPDNYLVCCKQCNSTKHANSLEDFRIYMAKKTGVEEYKFYGEGDGFEKR